MTSRYKSKNQQDKNSAVQDTRYVEILHSNFLVKHTTMIYKTKFTLKTSVSKKYLLEKMEQCRCFASSINARNHMKQRNRILIL